MYLISVNPEVQSLEDGITTSGDAPASIQYAINEVAPKANDGIVYVWQLVEKHKATVNVTSVGYLVKPNGEVVPK